MAFLGPDDQRNDWYAWATNQAGHSAIIGMPAALLCLPVFGPIWTPVFVALVYLTVWEVMAGHWRADWRDSLMDTAHVMAGASLLCGALAFGYWTAVACVLSWLCLIGFGVWQRKGPASP